MVKRRLIWHLFPAFLIVVVLAILGVTWYMTVSMKRLYLAETADGLKARAILVKNQIPLADIEVESPSVDSLCKRLGALSSTRFTVILPSGKVIGDTDDDPERMEDHSGRPEVSEALAGRTGISTRFSHTLHETMMYLAEPIIDKDRVVGVVRAALPVTAIDKAFEELYPKIILGGSAVALLAGLLSFYISRRISKPLEKLRKAAFHYSKGEFGHKLPSGNSLEIDELATTMNLMAAELDEKINTIVGQRNELDAMLSSMVEGLLVFDTSERLVRFNDEAARMLNLDADKVRGRFVQEAIRQVHLQKFVGRILREGGPLEDEIETLGDKGRVFQVHGTLLQNNKGDNLGALIILNDITSLRRLEIVRRDFVANVSHELRTPITSIKGFVETLREGAIKNPEDAERFLGIIARQADRLNAIIEDLLALSKIEEAEKSDMQLEKHRLKATIEDALSVCRAKAEAKGITIELRCDDDLEARINPALLEQALINLLDNAIKYSHTGGRVEVSAAGTSEGILIAVRDWGSGIERKHLPRLFERFYTADKARSRELGGTGLGLAIVRHIALIHNGKVEVDSTIGQGSVFTLYLPAA